LADSDTKDLPDPLDVVIGPAEAVPVGDADILVAQLAGDAIDKLIADAENGIVPPRKEPEPIPDPDPLDAIDEPKPNLEADPTELPPMPKPPAAAEEDPLRTGMSLPADSSDALTSDASDDENAEVQSALDSIFDSLNQKPAEDARYADANLTADRNTDPMAGGSGEKPQADPAQSLPRDVPPDIANDDGHGGSTSASPSDEPEIEHTVDDIPTSLDGQPDAQSDVRALLADAVKTAPKGPPAVVVLPLRLLNAPFAYVSDPTRDIVGQIAIVTLINALAVILYVLLFR
jgi:hypothetical protein